MLGNEADLVALLTAQVLIPSVHNQHQTLATARCAISRSVVWWCCFSLISLSQPQSDAMLETVIHGERTLPRLTFCFI